MPRDAESYLRDIQGAISRIDEFAGGLTIAEHQQNPMAVLAVERLLITIGEAVNGAIHADPALAGQITNHRDIVGFRNLLVHQYFEINHEIVWRVVLNHLPLLRAEAAALRAEF